MEITKIISSISIPTDELSSQIQHLINYFIKFEFIPIVNGLIYFCIYFCIGLLITFIVRWFVGKIAEKRISQHHSLLFRRITFYVGLTLSLILPLQATGINVSALLGAAGIIAGAVAFASQTAISNFLSGVFLEAEKPFVLGDFINVGDALGEVLSIDLLSVKLRTKDNVLVRIPNHTLLNAQFRNVSRFPIRRYDIKLRLSFNEDIRKINSLLLKSAADNPLCLKSPPPEMTILEFGESGVILQFSVWGKQATYSNLQANILRDIQHAFSAENVLPPPTYTIVSA